MSKKKSPKISTDPLDVLYEYFDSNKKTSESAARLALIDVANMFESGGEVDVFERLKDSSLASELCDDLAALWDWKTALTYLFDELYYEGKEPTDNWLGALLTIKKALPHNRRMK